MNSPELNRMAALMWIDRLSCGMPICIQTSDESQLLSISVWIKGGSAHDPVDKGGVAHLCEHLLLRPLTLPNSRAYQISLKTGALVNAYTDPEWVAISAQAPLEHAKHLIRLLSVLIRNPFLEPDGMKAEKEVILQELREKESGFEEHLVNIFRESAFTGNPCVQPIGGTPKTLGALNISDAQGYYTRFLNASKMLITVHGGACISNLIAMLEEAFQDFPEAASSCDSAKNEVSTSAQVLPDYRPVRINKQMSGKGSGLGVLAGFGSVPRNTTRYWAALAFEVLMADGPQSLLNQWFRNERHWIYGAFSMTEAFSNWGSQFFLLRLSHDRAEDAIKYLGQQWRGLPEFVTDERVDALKNRLASRALSSLAIPQDRMTMMRDAALAEIGKSKKLEGGLDALVAQRARELNSSKLLSYIRNYAEWDRVSLVCGPI